MCAAPTSGAISAPPEQIVATTSMQLRTRLPFAEEIEEPRRREDAKEDAKKFIF
jgi:hypothetical protein